MNIHIIRDTLVDPAVYADVLAILQSSPGPMNFIPGEDMAVHERGFEEVEIENYGEQIPWNRTFMSAFSEPLSSPWEIAYTWDDLFSMCNDYRVKKGLPDADSVILLTEYGNDMNWFGSAQEGANNFFIQTSQWSRFFGNNVEQRLPLAYEVAAWLLRKRMFDSWSDAHALLHDKPIGCMNDFCRDKQEVTLKIRTGDVCPDCLSQLQKRDVNPTIVRQAFHIMDHVRSGLTWKQRTDFLKQASRLEVRGPLMKLFLLDSGGLEVRLNPLERALYLLILDRTEGINLNYLDTERDKLLHYYTRFATQGNEAAHQRTIDSVCNLQENARNITLSRIRRKFIDSVGEDLARHYIPENMGDGLYRIPLDREFVVMG
jgi:hypothetical protein